MLEFKQYRTQEKPPKFVAKGNIEAALFTIQMKLRSSNRFLYQVIKQACPLRVSVSVSVRVCVCVCARDFPCFLCPVARLSFPPPLSICTYIHCFWAFGVPMQVPQGHEVAAINKHWELLEKEEHDRCVSFAFVGSCCCDCCVLLFFFQG